MEAKLKKLERQPADLLGAGYAVGQRGEIVARLPGLEVTFVSERGVRLVAVGASS